jgi:hypothetical protein
MLSRDPSITLPTRRQVATVSRPHHSAKAFWAMSPATSGLHCFQLRRQADARCGSALEVAQNQANGQIARGVLLPEAHW